MLLPYLQNLGMLGVIGCSVAVADGADVLAASVGPTIAASSATTDGADVLASSVGPTIAVSAATVDGADVFAASAGPTAAVSSATTDGADALAATVAPLVTVTSATTDGADTLAARITNAASAPAYFIPRPEGYTFNDWGSRVTETFAGFGMAEPPGESAWKEWVHSMFYEPALCAMNIPSPEGFENWQAWAAQFTESVR